MKINRTNETESYRTTVGWIGDFARKVAKNNPPPGPNLAIAKTEKFATIEEKMIDIKNRVGFENVLVKKEGGDSDSKKVAKENSCKCTKKCKCDKIPHMERILKYIEQIVKNEEELPSIAVIQKCREDVDLGFDSIDIDVEKLKKHIDKLSGFNKNNDNKNAVYIKHEVKPSDLEDDMADYYRHGLPNTR